MALLATHHTTLRLWSYCSTPDPARALKPLHCRGLWKSAAVRLWKLTPSADEKRMSEITWFTLSHWTHQQNFLMRTSGDISLVSGPCQGCSSTGSSRTTRPAPRHLATLRWPQRLRLPPLRPAAKAGPWRPGGSPGNAGAAASRPPSTAGNGPCTARTLPLRTWFLAAHLMADALQRDFGRAGPGAARPGLLQDGLAPADQASAGPW